MRPQEILYVHGMGGSPEDWRQVRARLPGKTLSLDPFSSAPQVCAAALAHQIQTTAKNDYALVGYSMGGRISLLATSALAKVGRMPAVLVLVSAGLGICEEQERQSRRQTDAEWADLARSNPALFWEQWYQQDIFSSLKALHPEILILWEESRLSMNIEALSAQLRHLGPGCHEDLRPVLADLLRKGLRVLYIVGELDKKYLELSKTVQEMGVEKVLVMPAAGHVLPLEAPLELAAAIQKFLE